MNPILKKLHLTNNGPVLIMNAPDELSSILEGINVEIHTEIEDYYDFIMVFAESIEEAEELMPDAINAFNGDGYLWFCYPKETSQHYDSDLDSGTILELFEPYDYEGVTLVSIHEDWSALRVRDVDDIPDDLNNREVFSDKGKRRMDD